MDMSLTWVTKLTRLEVVSIEIFSLSLTAGLSSCRVVLVAATFTGRHQLRFGKTNCLPAKRLIQCDNSDVCSSISEHNISIELLLH